MSPKKTSTKKAIKKPTKVAKKKVVSVKAVQHKAEKKHISPWWVFWTYLFGILFLGVIVGGTYVYHNPEALQNIDSHLGASILEDNVDAFCRDMYFGDKNTSGLFEVDEYVCQKGSIIPIEILYDSECPECLSVNIENTLKLIMPTAIITKTDVRAPGGNEVIVNTLPYVIIDQKVEGTSAMQMLQGKAVKVGEKYYLNTNKIINGPRTVVAQLNVEKDPVKGDKDAPITIIEFTGTQCPACAEFTEGYWDTVKSELIDKDLVKYYSKILPVGEDEEVAKLAANAALCAADQGKYYEFMNEFYSYGGGLDKDILLGMAEEVHLGVTEFEVCLDEKQTDELVSSHLKEIQRLEVNTLPSYLIDNKLYTGPQTAENLINIVQSELKRRGVAEEITVENINDEPTLGEGNLEIQVYSDFDCVQCRLDWQNLSGAIEGMEDQVIITFINLPNAANAYAEMAANAAECAVAQGDFWGYIELLFSNQGDLRNSTLERFGQQIGFGGDFSACVRAGEMLSEVKHDIESAKLQGIEKTPTYTIGGEIIEAPDSADGWRDLITQKL